MKKQMLILALLAAGVVCQGAPNVIFKVDFTKSQVAETTSKKVYPYPVKTGKNKNLEIIYIKNIWIT